MVYLLAQHPQVMARLREEVYTKVGPTKRPTYEDIREMKYLKAVINGEGLFYPLDHQGLILVSETLRLYPAV